ncbi:aminopeptidase [Deinococcus sp. Arct2-2]|uniref:aminopeptidase n=1 Tax=Deinococcus sp. Arct2-2 TaxID=2568653 RepID=UPI0010A37321|nr:aminopeptidase [Deinococcus sp. Arct2-2]THF70681.1 aminopeptidase [Deinococcus sp. Arct2-2]
MSSPAPSTPDFEAKLARYADLLVRVGVGLTAGGKVRIGAPVEAAAFARLVQRAAYRAGALDARVVYGDAHTDLALYEDGSDEAVAFLPAWQAQEREAMVADGYAFIGILGDDPSLLAGVDGGRVARRSKALAQAFQKVSEASGNFEVSWTVAAIATPAWARAVFPDLPEAEAVARLWDDIFAVTRVDTPDPVGAWQTHLAGLQARTDRLNEQRFTALHFLDTHSQGELGTDLTVGLADGHFWQGGAERAKNGVLGVPNFPTDEVFTAPHKDRVDGVAVASKPLSVRGQLVEGIRVRFEGGRAVEVSATRGEDTLRQLIATDEGAARLGEVALVPASAPVARTGTLFLNTLFDENAASHIALGRAYPTTIRPDLIGGTESATYFADLGGNHSLIHVDWMIGSPGMNVDGVRADGSREALMRDGEWVI